jgi:hypothetical protein
MFSGTLLFVIHFSADIPMNKMAVGLRMREGRSCDRSPYHVQFQSQQVVGKDGTSSIVELWFRWLLRKYLLNFQFICATIQIPNFINSIVLDSLSLPLLALRRLPNAPLKSPVGSPYA